MILELWSVQAFPYWCLRQGLFGHHVLCCSTSGYVIGLLLIVHFCQRLHGCQRAIHVAFPQPRIGEGKRKGDWADVDPDSVQRPEGDRRQCLWQRLFQGSRCKKRGPCACVPETSFPGFLLGDEWSPKMPWWTWENQDVRGWRCLGPWGLASLFDVSGSPSSKSWSTLTEASQLLHDQAY